MQLGTANQFYPAQGGFGQYPALGTNSNTRPNAALAQQAQLTQAVPSLNREQVHQYFSEMSRALGKDPRTQALSAEDFDKYAQILTNASELLDDTIQFSRRAESKETSRFQEQKQGLLERLGLTSALKDMFQQRKQNA